MDCTDVGFFLLAMGAVMYFSWLPSTNEPICSSGSWRQQCPGVGEDDAGVDLGKEVTGLE